MRGRQRKEEGGPRWTDGRKELSKGEVTDVACTAMDQPTERPTGTNRAPGDQRKRSAQRATRASAEQHGGDEEESCFCQAAACLFVASSPLGQKKHMHTVPAALSAVRSRSKTGGVELSDDTIEMTPRGDWTTCRRDYFAPVKTLLEAKEWKDLGTHAETERKPPKKRETMAKNGSAATRHMMLAGT
ncbi:hypothetical protein ERJ75_001097700 [Trypanosoma vivax]|nr:hypothetical protein TRVL_05549 [Trypanosoma vivax]KAH8610484.1 hypothetical protein ERJ75_001097700 [Trypanosoma vivax]